MNNILSWLYSNIDIEHYSIFIQLVDALIFQLSPAANEEFNLSERRRIYITAYFVKAEKYLIERAKAEEDFYTQNPKGTFKYPNFKDYCVSKGWNLDFWKEQTETKTDRFFYFVDSFDYYFVYFIFLAFFISILLFVVSFFIGRRLVDKEKISAYECGFSPFENSRVAFDVRFYLVTILFIIFDIEVVFLFPWVVVLDSIGFFGVISCFLFLCILTIGLLYEWFSGALDWE